MYSRQWVSAVGLCLLLWSFEFFPPYLLFAKKKYDLVQH